jgi:hypothetical protein
MPNSLTEGLTSANVLSAIRAIDRGVAHPFGPPIRYELLYEGKRYPPKAVVGLAVKHASGRIIGPEDFSAGEAPGQANYILRRLGFTVVNKDEPDVASTNFYITSRSFALPTDANEMADSLWFNIWQPRLWPYRELQLGDPLFWYDPTIQSIVWRSQVARIERFPFKNKREVEERLYSVFGVQVGDDPYFIKAANSGHCLAYQVNSVVHCDIPKPANYRLPQLGWIRTTDETAREWVQTLIALLAADGPATSEIRKVTDLVNGSGYFSVESLSDERERKFREIVTRRGQPDFRNRLISAYGGTCPITDCDAVAALEAAHIVPYCGPDSNHVTNGLLLRADVHTLFDLDLIGIDPFSRTVTVAETIQHSRYGELQGRKVTVPANAEAAPDQEALAQRWQRFLGIT